MFWCPLPGKTIFLKSLKWWLWFLIRFLKNKKPSIPWEGKVGFILLVVSTPPGVPSQAVLFNCCFIPVQIDKYPESIIQDYLSINSFHQKNQDIFLESRPMNRTMTFSKIPDSIKLVMEWLKFDTIRPD
jgi:hypothetical protein